MDFDDWDGYDARQQADGDQQQDQHTKEPPAKPKRVIRRRPKLTLTNLEQPNGLKEVFEKFPKWFQEGYSGKGHEVRDLRRLLELYQRWQPRVFNHGSYNQFEQALEKMSGTHVVKTMLHGMREGLAKIVDPPVEQLTAELDEPPLQEEQQQQTQQDTHKAHGQPADAAAGRALDDLDDDELLELQQQAAEEAAEAALPEAFEEFDEHNPVEAPRAGTAAAQAGRAQATGEVRGNMVITHKRTARDWSDDDDDDDDDDASKPARNRLCKSTENRQQPQQTAADHPEEYIDRDMDDQHDNLMQPQQQQKWSEGTAAPKEQSRAAPPGRPCRRKAAAAVDTDEEDEDSGIRVTAANPVAYNKGDAGRVAPETTVAPQPCVPQQSVAAAQQEAAGAMSGQQQQQQLVRQTNSQWQLHDDDSDNHSDTDSDDDGDILAALALQQQRVSAATAAALGIPAGVASKARPSGVLGDTVPELHLVIGTELQELVQEQDEH